MSLLCYGVDSKQCDPENAGINASDSKGRYDVTRAQLKSLINNTFRDDLSREDDVQFHQHAILGARQYDVLSDFPQPTNHQNVNDLARNSTEDIFYNIESEKNLPQLPYNHVISPVNFTEKNIYKPFNTTSSHTGSIQNKELVSLLFPKEQTSKINTPTMHTTSIFPVANTVVCNETDKYSSMLPLYSVAGIRDSKLNRQHDGKNITDNAKLNLSNHDGKQAAGKTYCSLGETYKDSTVMTHDDKRTLDYLRRGLTRRMPYVTNYNDGPCYTCYPTCNIYSQPCPCHTPTLLNYNCDPLDIHELCSPAEYTKTSTPSTIVGPFVTWGMNYSQYHGVRTGRPTEQETDCKNNALSTHTEGSNNSPNSSPQMAQPMNESDRRSSYGSYLSMTSSLSTSLDVSTQTIGCSPESYTTNHETTYEQSFNRNEEMSTSPQKGMEEYCKYGSMGVKLSSGTESDESRGFPEGLDISDLEDDCFLDIDDALQVEIITIRMFSILLNQQQQV